MRAGFTLVEVTAGLALIGLVLGGILVLIQGTTDGRERIEHEAEVADGSANGERLLSSLFANAEVSSDSVNRFVGDEESASFNTWCVVPQGWQERCRAHVRVSNGQTGADVLWVAGRDTRSLRHFDEHVQFRYFGSVGAEEQWSNQWGRSIALPGAIALVSATDTIVIGGRGRR